MWLTRRIAVAVRATDLLEQKQRLLGRERRRLAELAQRTGQEWVASAAAVDVWTARALVTGGRDELRRTAPVVGLAVVHLEETTQAGVSYPSQVDIVLPPPPPPTGSAALGSAAEACRAALEVAVRHAATSAALARVDAELRVTVRRLRAVRDRWVPRLERELAALELRLDESERQESTRLRWARSPTGTGGGR